MRWDSDTPSLLAGEQRCAPGLGGQQGRRASLGPSSGTPKKTQSDDSAGSKGRGSSQGKCPGWEQPQKSQALSILQSCWSSSPLGMIRHNQSLAWVLRGRLLMVGTLPWGSPNCWSHRRSPQGAHSGVHPGHLLLGVLLPGTPLPLGSVLF